MKTKCFGNGAPADCKMKGMINKGIKKYNLEYFFLIIIKNKPIIENNDRTKSALNGK